MSQNNHRPSTQAETANQDISGIARHRASSPSSGNPQSSKPQDSQLFSTPNSSTRNDSSGAIYPLIGAAAGRTQSGRGKQARGAERDAIIAAISQCAAQLGRVPTIRELEKICHLNDTAIKNNFGNYGNAFKACGLELEAGHRVTMENLFRDFAGVVRMLGKTPTVAEYELHGRYSEKPMATRFGPWRKVPGALADFAEKNGLAGEWLAEIEMMKASVGRRAEIAAASAGTTATDGARRHRLLADRPVYGASLLPVAPMHAPTNEQGVVYLFGALASRLGYVVLLIGQEFPDCVAFREVEAGMWQLVKIEFEFESRNFLRHGHDAKECDLVVCWKHNWAECPLEVVELRREIEEILPRMHVDFRGLKEREPTTETQRHGEQHGEMLMRIGH